MPKRKRSSKKEHRKINVKHIEHFVQERVAEQDAERLIQKKSNAELFIDDRKTRSRPLNKSGERPPESLNKVPKKVLTAEEVKNLQALHLKKKRKITPNSQSGLKRPKQGPYDLWEDGPRAPVSDESKEWLEPALAKPLVPPKWILEKPSAVPALQIDAGTSYRPSYEAHQDLLAAAVAVELKKKEKEKKWDRMMRRERKNAPKLENVAEVDDVTPTTDTANLDAVEDPVERDADSEDEEKPKIHNPFSTKLTQTQRNKMKRRLEQERERLKKYELKAQRRKFQKLPQILAEIDESQKIHEKLLEERRKKREEKKLLATKRLGPHRFEEANKDVLLSDELPSSLRALQPPTTLFMDRYKSLQRRNLVEPRKKTTQIRKYKKKTYQKHSSKMEYEL